jgi:Xaa-Pro aminopeptidase
MDHQSDAMTDVYAKRRAAVLKKLGPRGALVLSAAHEIMVGRDTELRYVVDAEVYYLTGYTEPEAVLVLTRAASEAQFTMFVRPRDDSRELWTGVRGGPQAARERFQAEAAHPVTELETRLPALLAGCDVVYARSGTARPQVDAVLQRVFAQARAQRARTGRSPHTCTDPGELLDPMRMVKEPKELELIREAARISCDAFLETIARVRPRMGEWEVEASIEYGFRMRGADGPAFPTIAAAGDNATVLHYVDNRAFTRADDLILVDAGARYRMYCADITRTVPVSGKFTDEQRDLYDVVLAAHDAAIKTIRPGSDVDAPHIAAQRTLADGLIQLRYMHGTVDAAIEDETGLRRFFPHRTSHWLGLEVHDVGAYMTRDGPVRLGERMVMTIEPGLYIRESGIGIRIEDDVVVTATGCEVLTARVPTNPAELESLVQSGA